MGNYENVKLRAAVFILKMTERSAGASLCRNNVMEEKKENPGSDHLFKLLSL